MDFVAAVDQVIALLRQWGRVAYRTRRRYFQRDDGSMQEHAYTPRRQHRARDKQGRMRVWLGEPTLPLSASTTREAVRPQTPLSSVAPSRPDVARRQLPVLCGDLVGSTALATQRASRRPSRGPARLSRDLCHGARPR